MNKHRQQLKSNELASWLETQVGRVSPYLKLVGAVIAVTIVVGITIYFVRSQSQKKSGASWQAFIQAGNDPENLLEMAKKYPGTVAALWARASRADTEINRASSQLYLDRVKAREATDNAIEDYGAVLQSAPANSLLHSQARFGLGQAYELQFDVAQALEHYREVDAVAAPALYREAQSRIKELGNPETESFYLWFARQEPARPGLPPGHVPIGAEMDTDLPPSLSGLDDFPSLDIPQAAPSAESTTPESGIPDLKAPAPADAKPGDAKPADPKPGDAKPGDAKPADSRPDAKPADSKPADPKPDDAKPADGDAKPADPKPDAKPADPKPDDAKPADGDAKPADPKPADGDDGKS